jgi:hypothetical protein
MQHSPSSELIAEHTSGSGCIALDRYANRLRALVASTRSRKAMLPVVMIDRFRVDARTRWGQQGDV